MKHLLTGHHHFRSEYFENEGDFLQQLASHGQNPSALYISCCDSRVVPELLTGSQPGELFVVRNIANCIPPSGHDDVSVGAAIEYAVEVLKVKHVIICGHDGCGGVAATIKGLDQVASYKCLADWLQLVAPAVEAVKPSTELRDAVEENVLVQMDNLITYPVVERALAEKRLDLHSWVYDIANGRLRVYDVKTDEFKTPETVVQSAS